jgi:diguanylate cyclase (GGDEF)-like protein
MIKRQRQHAWERPNWLVYLLLPALHFASLKLTFFCAATSENEVVVWLPNAVLLAALLHFRGRRAWLLALLTASSDLIGNLPVFPPLEAVLLTLVNLTEVTVVYLVLRNAKVSPDLARLPDMVKFVVAGPLVGALLAGFLGAAVLQWVGGATTAFMTLMRVWWFGDGLGLLIYTPLLLALIQPRHDVQRLRVVDGCILLLILALAMVVFTSHGGSVGGVSVTPTLLLPAVLYISARFGMRWTALAVALISLTTAWVLTTGQHPFGAVPGHLEIVRAQEFILTLSIMGLGSATLFSELKMREHGLEDMVRARTHELAEANAKLLVLSVTDALTGIANRRRFDEALADEWSRARRSGRPLTLVLLDVDFFKQYNDQYGHFDGDDCLRAVAQVLVDNALRTSDLVARYGGEEFALIAPDTDEAGALCVAENIRLALESLRLPHARSPFSVVTASLGVAALRVSEQDSVTTLIKMADEALYHAKQSGRNQVVVGRASAVTT